jgi:hypothetical protein
MVYTQDESCYLLDAGEDGSVYLGLKDAGLTVCDRGMGRDDKEGVLFDENIS